MLDVTELILNFQKLLVAIGNVFSAIGLYKGSDEWEELSESAFRILVVNHIKEKLKISISDEYELWDQSNKKLFVQVDAGISILAGEKDNSSESKYYFDDVTTGKNLIRFSFIEFGNPSFNEEDVAGLEYVTGLDEDGRVICARKEDCQFFVTA